MNTDARSTTRSITKSVGINRDPDLVFAYLVDPANWPQWTVVNVTSVAGPDGSAWRDMMAPHGPAKLRIRPDACYRILDLDWHDPQARWTVPARVVANGGGAEFMMTFFQPATFSDCFFDKPKLVGIELTRLKQALET
jgi:uncharacterized protein YndB with AHSA1/START domain